MSWKASLSKYSSNVYNSYYKTSIDHVRACLKTTDQLSCEQIGELTPHKLADLEPKFTHCGYHPVHTCTCTYEVIWPNEIVANLSSHNKCHDTLLCEEARLTTM